MGKRKPYHRANLAYELAKLKLDGSPGGTADSALVLFDTLDEVRRQLGWPRRSWNYKEVGTNKFPVGMYENKLSVDAKSGKIACSLRLTMADGKDIFVDATVSIGQIGSSNEPPAWAFSFGDDTCWLDPSNSEKTKEFFHKAAHALQKKVILAGASTA